jgi:hypothetical protein
MKPLGFVVQHCSVKSLSSADELNHGGYWAAEFPVERCALLIEFRDASGAPARAALDAVSFEGVNVSHIEARAATAYGSKGLGEVVFPRVQASSMLEHRSDVENLRRTASADSLWRTATLLNPSPLPPECQAEHAPTGIMLFVLSLWEPLTAPSLRNLRLYGRMGAAVSTAAIATTSVPVPSNPPTKGPLVVDTPAPAKALVISDDPIAPPPMKKHESEVPALPHHLDSAPAYAPSVHHPSTAPHTTSTTGSASTNSPPSGPASSAPLASSPPHAAAGHVTNGSKPLHGVTLCLSGFQNPLRGELRDKAIALGAVVLPDWTPTSTHLVCVVPNTPKHLEQKKSGYGVAVSRHWLEDCAAMKKRMPEVNYPIAPTYSVV